jgi:S-adenosylmethionine-diacylglycerol 3-amino-3-carboxypropyl transferase
VDRLKFAVVREDPELEADLVRRVGAREVLLVASGGCTTLSLATCFPDLRVTAFDFNPAQLAHLREKATAVEQGHQSRLNVGDSARDGLNQRGDFEGLFRLLRSFLLEFVLTEAELSRFFSAESSLEVREAMLARWRSTRYWPAAFQVALADGFLEAMFGPAATQHAERGSYPGYFQRVFERGLARSDAARNPFLQHVLLGLYRSEDAPAYLQARRELAFTLVEGTLLDVPDLGRFDLFSLSNVFDWSDDALVASWAGALGRGARAGAVVLLRQLNNQRPLRRFFEPYFAFDDVLGAEYLKRDRSLFYERIEVGVSVGAR